MEPFQRLGHGAVPGWLDGRGMLSAGTRVRARGHEPHTGGGWGVAPMVGLQGKAPSRGVSTGRG